MTNERIKLAEIIKGEMKEKRLTQVEVGRRSGVRLATISDFLNGKQGVGTNNIERLLTALKAKIKFPKTETYENSR